MFKGLKGFLIHVIHVKIAIKIPQDISHSKRLVFTTNFNYNLVNCNLYVNGVILL